MNKETQIALFFHFIALGAMIISASLPFTLPFVKAAWTATSILTGEVFLLNYIKE